MTAVCETEKATEVVTPSVVPSSEGWRLVPVEPTKEMLEAGSDAGGFDAYRVEQNTPDIWKAMLAAAPKPPSE